MTEQPKVISRQETFNTIVSHLRKQGDRAGKTDGCGVFKCYYKLDGMACAAGCLIPDEKYQPEFEHTNLRTFDNNLNPVGQVIADEGHDLILVEKMQQIHDWNLPHDWEIQFAEVAKRFELTVLALEKP